MAARESRDRAAKRIGRERLEMLKAYRAARGCADCGNDDPRVLEFDHVRGEKFAGVSRMYTYSLERLMAEVEKCDVVCANCHRIRTAERRLEVVA